MKAFILQIKTVLTLLFIGLSLSLSAINSHSSNSYFDHLSEINAEWQYHKEVAPKGTISFNSDIDRIQLHLHLAIKHLQTNIPANFNSKQVSNRLNLLEKLQDYADKKVFPINKYHIVRTPYFVDHLGTNCAVGQMIYVSGHEDLVAKISKEHNYDYIRNIRTEGLVEWANEFGFTVDELKWIQPGYPPEQTIDQLGEGTNGTVNKIVYNNYYGGLLIVGEFTELDNSPCLNIGFYRNNQLSCYGSGLEGRIIDVLQHDEDVIAFGEILNNGESYPAAIFDGSNWSYMEIPSREGAIVTAANFGGWNYQFKIAIRHNSIPNQQEIWHYKNDNTWERQAKVNGFIRDINASSFGRTHVGYFDSVVVYNSNNSIDTTFSANNVLIEGNIWYSIEGDISDTVNVVESVGNALIFGGNCSSQPGENNVCISRYYNSVLQPLYLNHFENEEFIIKTIAIGSQTLFGMDNEFLFGGDFNMNPMNGFYGNNLATYNLVTNFVRPIAIFDQPVNSISYDILSGDLFIGGAFQSNMGSPVNHLGRISSTVGTNEFPTEKNINIYPNPFTSTLNLEGIKDGTKYSILHIDGRTAKNGIVLDERINNLTYLPKGSYLLRVETKEGVIVKRVLK